MARLTFTAISHPELATLLWDLVDQMEYLKFLFHTIIMSNVVHITSLTLEQTHKVLRKYENELYFGMNSKK